MAISILHLRSSFIVGGPEKLIFSGIKHMECNEFDFILSSFILNNIENEFLKFALNEGIKTEPIHIKSSFDLSAVKSLREIITEHNVKLIILHDYRAVIIGYFASRRMDIPLLAVAHGWTSQGLKVKFYEFIEKLALRYMDKISAVSLPKYKELLNLGISSEKLEKIENCVEVPARDKILRNNRFKNKLGLPNDYILIGNVGRLSTEKGHKFLIQAAAKLKKDFTKIKFVIVGNGPLLGNLKSFASKLDVADMFYFTNWLSDIEVVYRGIDIFVLPSLTEGLPIALLEAMSYGLPVVVSSVGGCPDVVIDDECGYLIKPRDVDRLAQALSDLICNEEKRKAFGEMAYTRIAHKYNIKMYAINFLKLYRKMLS